MKSNKEIVQQVVDAFSKGDSEMLKSVLAEDAEWNMLGEFHVKGSKEFIGVFDEHKAVKIVETNVEHFIEGNNQVAVTGDVRCLPPGGKESSMYYADVYELENGKVRKLISYIVEKK